MNARAVSARGWRWPLAAGTLSLVAAGLLLPDRPAAARPAEAVSLPAVEDDTLVLINEMRGWAGARPLTTDDTLREIARRHSADMLARGFFDHLNPDGDDARLRAGRTHRTLIGGVAENIFAAEGLEQRRLREVARQAADGWFSSDGHRQNIVDPSFTHTGIGIVHEGRRVRATQVFAAVRGFTTTPVPASVTSGAIIHLEVLTDRGPLRDGMFDLWDYRTLRRALGPEPLGRIKIAARRGNYRTRFLFPDGDRSYEIFEGPLVEVK